MYLQIVVAVVVLAAAGVVTTTTPATLLVNLTEVRRPMPNTLFGIFFEEINHAGSGLWAELVSNKGFEAGIAPWTVIGDEDSILVSIDRSSSFKRNPSALRMDVLHNTSIPVGVSNPGFWGMNVMKGGTYRVVFYIRSIGDVNLRVCFATTNGSDVLATENVLMFGSSRPLNWTRMDLTLTANQSYPKAQLDFTTTLKGSLWLDQISCMPQNTYKGHGFRQDVMQMLVGLKPGFLRFPGGTFVEGKRLSNAVRWKDTIGAWEERPGHYGDVWEYWTDDSLGFYELLILAEDLAARPVWVINCGISREEHVNVSDIQPFIQDMLDGIEFARGESSSPWGSVRAGMGHPKPFQLQYVAIGNEDCDFPFYNEHYLKFYKALKQAYPDIQAISNCDLSKNVGDPGPVDVFDYHRYTPAAEMFSLQHAFDATPHGGPKVFVSEYAVKDDAGLGNVLAALGEAAFLIGVEKNSDIVIMSCYAPLMVNSNDRRWNPDAIVFDSSRAYGTPSYWMQTFFSRSNGASLITSVLQSEETLVASAISYDEDYITVKVVNFGNQSVNLVISFELDRSMKLPIGISKMILSSSNVTDENSFENPTKVYPQSSLFAGQAEAFNVSLPAYSLQSFLFSLSS